MQKVYEFKKGKQVYSITTDGFFKKEIFCDGVFEILELDNVLKIRFYSNTGIATEGKLIVEHNLSVVMQDQEIRQLYLLLEKYVDASEGDPPEKDFEKSNVDDDKDYKILDTVK